MQHQDHVNLIRGGIVDSGSNWADLGSGSGAFTLALADLLGAEAKIYSIDRDARSLQVQAAAMRARFPEASVEYMVADFTSPLTLSSLDGVLMANSLHFVRHKQEVLRYVSTYLRPGGRLILVEYNADRGNPWVPYPLSYPSWEKLSLQQGFASTRLLTTVPSRFLHEIYSAMSVRAEK